MRYHLNWRGLALPYLWGQVISSPGSWLCSTEKEKQSNLKEGNILTSSFSDPLPRDRSVVSWRVKCVEQGENQCYTTLLLDNSRVHSQHFIFLGKLAN